MNKVEKVVAMLCETHIIRVAEPVDAPSHEQLLAQWMMATSGPSDLFQLLALWCSAPRRTPDGRDVDHH